LCCFYWNFIIRKKERRTTRDEERGDGIIYHDYKLKRERERGVLENNV